MRFTLILENKSGDRMNMTTTINQYMTSKIVIQFEMRGFDIEKRRHQLYKVVRPSRYIKIYYRTSNIDVYTEGYVETCEMDNFSSLTKGQISIICPDIYWYSVTPVYAYYRQITGVFHFPFLETDVPFPLGTYNRRRCNRIYNSDRSC